MANKKKQTKYECPRPISAPKPSPLVLQTVYNYYRSHPDIYNVLPDAVVSKLDGPRLVQSVAKRTSLSSWKGFRDYFKQGEYLGRVTVTEGELISMEVV